MQLWTRLRRSVAELIARLIEIQLGLKTTMTLLSVIGMIALIGIFSVLAIAAARETTDRALQERVVLAQVAAKHADYVLGTVRAGLDALAAHPFMRQDRASREDRENELRDVVVRHSFPARQIFLLQPTGEIAADSGDTDLRILPNIFPMVQSNAFVVTSIALEPNARAIIAAVPVRDASNRVIGAVAAMLDLTEFGVSTLAPAATLGNTGYVEIVDVDGLIVSSTLPQRLLSRADHGESLVAMIGDGKSVVTTCHNCHNTATDIERRLEVIAFAPLKNAPWGVVVRQAEEEAFGSSRQLQGRIVLFAIVAVAGAIVLVWLTTRYIIAPVQNLKLAAEQMVRGNWETPIAVRRGDEIGALADTFETMRAQLRQNIAEIQDLNRDLDQRVQARTRELSALNAVAGVVTQQLHLDEFLGKTLQQVLTVAGADAGTVFLLSEESRALEPQCCLGTSEDAARAITRLHLDDSACGGVIEKGQPVIVPDLSRYTAGAGRSLYQEGLRSLVHVPLISRGVALGTMCVGTRTPREFTPREVELLMALGNQIAVGVENARLYDELARREQLRGDLLEKVITAQEEERKRIARDLHDDTSQSLSALIYSMEAAETTCADPRLHQTMGHMRGVLAQTLDGIHKLIHDLRPSMLDHLGLFVALRWYAETRLKPANMRLRVEERGALRRLPPQLETALFRVGQEAINNIARHSGARNVRLKFDGQDGTLHIEIRDDGIGFDLIEVEHSADRQRGLGLAGMQERVGLLGGQIHIISTPGHGTQVSISVPMEHV
ncbi:MAG: GAF domain-containing protein [Chloroflexi bacterium]|nr:GAF domain-containing protein [Chloroflexota bacterium]